MILKRNLIALVFGFICPLTSIAGSEDWIGIYQVKTSNNSLQTVTHSPTQVQFMFVSAGHCLRLTRGSKLNGVTIPNNVTLCSTHNIEQFNNEVKKLGVIMNQSIKVGPTY